MIEVAPRRVDTADLRAAGRQPATPFSLTLADGDVLVMTRLLRVLPGKRIVGEGEWKGRRVLAKLFIADGSKRHCTQEKSGLEALCQAGIPTPELLMAAPIPAGGHVLLTAFLDDAQSLAEAWAPPSGLPAGDAESVELLSPAFALLGILHASGLIQKDLHFGNFLRSAGTLQAIDGDAVQAITPGKALDETAAVANLAVLLAQLPMAWETHQADFLAAYASGAGRGIEDLQRLGNEISRVRRARLDEFLGKTVRECTLFSVTHSARRFCAVQRVDIDRLAPLIEAPDRAMRGGEMLKDGRTSTVVKVAQGDERFVVKRYNLKNSWHALGRLWRPSRAWHSWREGHRLRFLGIATPEPLALIEERIGPLRRRAFLINAYCPGVNLMQHLSPDQEPDAATAAALLSLFEILHKQRISHGDLKATNLLWHDGQLFVIDLDAMTQHRSAKAFARAWQRDRARLLRNWPATSVLHRWLDTRLPKSD